MRKAELSHNYRIQSDACSGELSVILYPRTIGVHHGLVRVR